jgi:hypothetical protein
MWVRPESTQRLRSLTGSRPNYFKLTRLIIRARSAPVGIGPRLHRTPPMTCSARFPATDRNPARLFPAYPIHATWHAIHSAFPALAFPASDKPLADAIPKSAANSAFPDPKVTSLAHIRHRKNADLPHIPQIAAPGNSSEHSSLFNGCGSDAGVRNPHPPAPTPSRRFRPYRLPPFRPKNLIRSRHPFRPSAQSAPRNPLAAPQLR